MENDIRVVLADSSDDFLAMLSEYISREPGLELCASAQDGEEALRQIRAKRPDVFVTDILLRRVDGMSVIRELRSTGELPRTIVVSAFFNDSIASEISTLGAVYCFPKPFKISELISRIKECLPDGQQTAGDGGAYDALITEALINFGIMPHLQGYRYLREAIRRNIDDSSVLRGVTKILYPDLAKQFGTNPKCIERSMRNAIETAWRRAGSADRDEYFGETMKRFAERPTNSRFIAAMTEFVLVGRLNGGGFGFAR